jgi:hypothetical protein
VTLLTQPFQQQMVSRLRDGGKVIIANSAPSTETMSRPQYRFPRFVETESVSYLARAHLYSPIGLADQARDRSRRGIAKQIRRHLDFGSLYYYYKSNDPGGRPIPLAERRLTAYMYPFTPIELREGVLFGRERILTGRRGIFGWNDASGHVVHVFDEDGGEVAFDPVTYTEKGKTWTRLELPDGYTAVIVRASMAAGGDANRRLPGNRTPSRAGSEGPERPVSR